MKKVGRAQRRRMENPEVTVAIPREGLHVARCARCPIFQPEPSRNLRLDGGDLMTINLGRLGIVAKHKWLANR